MDCLPHSGGFNDPPAPPVGGRGQRSVVEGDLDSILESLDSTLESERKSMNEREEKYMKEEKDERGREKEE